MDNSSLNRIQRMGKIARISTIVAMLVLIGFAIFMVIKYLGYPGLIQKSWTIPAEVSSEIRAQVDRFSNGTLFAALFQALSYFLLMLYGLWQTMKLCKLYEIGEIFTAANVQRIKKIALTAILLGVMPVITGIIYCFFVGTFITIPDIVKLVIGLVIYLIAWVMDEARKMKEEQDLVV